MASHDLLLFFSLMSKSCRLNLSTTTVAITITQCGNVIVDRIFRKLNCINYWFRLIIGHRAMFEVQEWILSLFANTMFAQQTNFNLVTLGWKCRLSYRTTGFVAQIRPFYFPHNNCLLSTTQSTFVHSFYFTIKTICRAMAIETFCKQNSCLIHNFVEIGI